MVFGENEKVRVRFVVGPAGTGKTRLCLKEIGQELLESPEGPPLLFLAPKQATFQLERQLLDSQLEGYTRLHVLSFERLAEFAFEQLQQSPPPLLSEQGRAMVLRALLERGKERLRIFGSSAVLPGFATQLSAELRELQQHQLGPAGIETLAEQPGLNTSLRAKLQDLSLLLSDYLRWLQEHQLQDSGCWLDLAARALRMARPGGEVPQFVISRLWLDGFAEMTPQELTLLGEIARCCQEMTLCFCIDCDSSQPEPNRRLSIWAGIQRTLEQCSAKLLEVPGASFETIVLKRDSRRGRFVGNPVISHLEENWGRQTPAACAPSVGLDNLRVAICPDVQSEAVLAAREILRFVRQGDGKRRFRDVAVLVRSLEGYQEELRRAFARYEIPAFSDRREPVSHHPLAELTRNALRLAAGDWQHEDWFSALKTGLVTEEQDAIDHMENEALARGWTGNRWRTPFAAGDPATAEAEVYRKKWTAPFLKWIQAVQPPPRKSKGPGQRAAPTGAELAEALRQLWRDLDAEGTLQKWSLGDTPGPGWSGDSPLRIHSTVWQEMNGWLDDVALAFGQEALPLSQWLTILEAGLDGLTVGVIPPALDQVLIGTVDRSRNPDLKLALVLGVNETVFPATSTQGRLLSEADRDELLRSSLALGLDNWQLLGREYFLGYIACTRSSDRLVVTCARQDGRGESLNPSAFISHLQKLFPHLCVEQFTTPDWQEAEHAVEVIPKALETTAANGAGSQEWKELLEVPAIASVFQRVQSLAISPAAQRLSPEMAAQLYGEALQTSVSALEQFAACSFRFFVHAGLQAEERKLFELDPRQSGSFQHEVLAQFHQRLEARGMKWRDLAPAQAREQIATIAQELQPRFGDGVLSFDARSRFAARAMSRSLQDCVAAMVHWARQYQFDPYAVELAFGNDSGLPGWELELEKGRRLTFRGRIDRIDLCKLDEDCALAVVIDYKSAERRLDAVRLHAGLQLQLPAYLGVLQHLEDPRTIFGAARLMPAGVFYVNLRGDYKKGRTRDEVLQEETETAYKAYKHLGRFDFQHLRLFDNTGSTTGTQFNFKLCKDGSPDGRYPDPMAAQAFAQLLEDAHGHLVRIGREIFGGAIEANPFEHRGERACKTCLYQGICRIDPWTHSFRALTLP